MNDYAKLKTLTDRRIKEILALYLLSWNKKVFSSLFKKTGSKLNSF